MINIRINKYDLFIYLYIIQEYLDLLYEWLCINKLSIHIHKFTAILFNIINSPSYIILNITINNINIEFNSIITFLGLFIDYKLNRPISLLTQLSKLLEKLIKVRFTSYLNTYNIISDSQYGFMANMF